MPRLRLAIALVLAGSIGATASISAAAPEGRAWTHRLTALTGEYVNHWTVNNPEPCGLVGDGTVTVSFRITVAPRVSLVYSRTSSAEPSGYGRWIIGVPSAHGPGLFDGPRRPATGTITLVDNTTQRPPEPDQECDPPQKAGCGTRSLGRTTVSFSGYNRRFLQADLAATFRPGPGGCGIGRTERFSDPLLTGGTREGELLMGMPSVATVKRRRVLIVTGATRNFTDCDYPYETCTDDITRRVTATFKKL